LAVTGRVRGALFDLGVICFRLLVVSFFISGTTFNREKLFCKGEKNGS
jgi:hypothetical protein